MNKLKNLINRFKKLVNNKFNELLVLTSFLLITVNTLSINIHVGIYVMAILLLITAFTSKEGGEK